MELDMLLVIFCLKFLVLVEISPVFELGALEKLFHFKIRFFNTFLIKISFLLHYLQLPIPLFFLL
jgi:hypothetical protein